ncbi:MAG: DUF1559 domain-containing protein, partial [Lentisphaeria bacterium]|nr:DUF1559 domain-containing protein [Lentisphaeria bacterium]
MLMPALQQARDRAKTASCVNNLKQLGIQVHAYYAAFDDMLMPQDGMTRYDNIGGVDWHEGTSWFCNTMKKSDAAHSGEVANVPKAMICPAVPPDLRRCFGSPAWYAPEFMKNRSYSMPQGTCWSAKTVDKYCAKYLRFRNPSKVIHMIDGIGMPSYAANAPSDYEIEYPFNGRDGRRVDYRHGGCVNVLALGGNVVTTSKLKQAGPKGDFDHQEGLY